MVSAQDIVDANNWPLLLAGPMVRRVESNSVSIWLATSKSSQVTLKIWQGAKTAAQGIGVVEGQSNPINTTSTNTRSFGTRLHVAVITLAINPGLMPNSEYAYDLVFDNTHDLRSMGLLQNGRLSGTDGTAPDNVALGYQENRLPSFLTPPANANQLVLAQASCRKTTSEGEDATTYLDEQIEQQVTRNEGVARPHQLMLTGDQIYADDVAGPLLQRITDLAELLLGQQEPIDMGGAPDPLLANQNLPDSVPLNSDKFPPMSRQRLFYVTGQMTSSAADSHLIGFGEFAAMYLLAWSAVLWNNIDAPQGDDLPPDLDCITRDPRCTNFKNPPAGNSKEKEHFDKDMKHVKDLWKTERNALPGYRDGVARVRRLLANVSTYMVFDDHEVTDDWNITREWTLRVRQHAFSKTIFRNGLASFTVFQAWGNNPAAWNTPARPVADVLGRTANLIQQRFSSTAKTALDTSLGVGLDEPARDVNWHFNIDFGSYILVGLDTRNHRYFNSSFSPPGLLNDDQITEQIPLRDPNNKLLLLISPAPLLGLTLIDEIGLPLAFPILDAVSTLTHKPAHIRRPRGQDPIAFTGQTFADTEAWSVDEHQFEAALDRITNYRSVIVISGDVHYSCSLAMDYWRNPGQGRPARASSRIVQFTSSGARNKWYAIVRALFSSVHTLDGLLAAGTPAEKLIWNERRDDELPLDSPIDNAEHAPHALRSRLYIEPVIVPTHAWPNQAAEHANFPPNRAWRVQMLTDQRADYNPNMANTRPEQVSPPVVQNIDSNEPFASHRMALNMHANGFEQGDAGRKLVWEHNSALITFGTDVSNNLVATSHNLGRNLKYTPRTNYAEVLTQHRGIFTLSTDDRPRIPQPE